MTGAKTSVAISYRNESGWHVFVSDDLPGLYVASQDLSTAYEDVARSIQELFWLDEGIECHVAPELPLSDFLATVKGVDSDFDDMLATSRRFAVYGAHA